MACQQSRATEISGKRRSDLQPDDARAFEEGASAPMGAGIGGDGNDGRGGGRCQGCDAGLQDAGYARRAARAFGEDNDLTLRAAAAAAPARMRCRMAEAPAARSTTIMPAGSIKPPKPGTRSNSRLST